MFDSIGTDLQDDFCEDMNNAYTLPAKYYVSEDVFAFEKERIFTRAWLCLCHASELTELNSYVTRRIVGENLVAVRGRDGVLRAFYNVCPHRGHELFKDSGTAKNVVACPYHAWTFKLDGELSVARNCENVANFDKSDFNLTPLRVAEYAGFVFVNMDMDAAPVETVLQGLDERIKSVCPNIAELQVASRTITDTPANWKVIVDNYMECYHCPPAHPSFSTSVDSSTYTHTFHGNWTLQHGLSQSSSSSYSFDGTANNQAFNGFWAWPCVMFNVAPGDDTVTVIYEYPVSAGLTVQYYDVLMKSKDVAPEQRDFITWATQTFRPEDLRLVESVQRGLQSRGYRGQGRIMVDADHSGISEHGIAYFHRMMGDIYQNK